MKEINAFLHAFLFCLLTNVFVSGVHGMESRDKREIEQIVDLERDRDDSFILILSFLPSPDIYKTLPTSKAFAASGLFVLEQRNEAVKAFVGQSDKMLKECEGVGQEGQFVYMDFSLVRKIFFEAYKNMIHGITAHSVLDHPRKVIRANAVETGIPNRKLSYWGVEAIQLNTLARHLAIIVNQNRIVLVLARTAGMAGKLICYLESKARALQKSAVMLFNNPRALKLFDDHPGKAINWLPLSQILFDCRLLLALRRYDQLTSLCESILQNVEGEVEALSLIHI